MSKAHILLVLRHTAANAYRRYLKLKNITHDVVCRNGAVADLRKLPCGWIEYTDATKTTIKRLVICSFHPERFLRDWGANKEDAQKIIAFRERLIDFATVLLHQEPYHQTFLSILTFCWQRSTGIIILTTILENFDPANPETLAVFSRRPTLDTAPLDERMERNPRVSKETMKTIGDLRKSVNVKPTDASKYWDKPEARDVCGGYTFSLKIMSERYQIRNEASRH